MESRLLISFLGLLTFPILLFIWNRAILGKKEVSSHLPSDTIGLFFLNAILYFLLQYANVEIWGSVGFEIIESWETGAFLLLGKSAIGFLFYYFFSSAFLGNSSLLIMLSVIYIPVVSWGISEFDKGGSAWFHFSLAMWFVVGKIFIEKKSIQQTEIDDVESDRENEWNYFLWTLGLNSIVFLKISSQNVSFSDAISWVSGSLWMVSIAGLTALFSHKWSGRDFSDRLVVMAGIWSGFSFYAMIPSPIEPLLFVLFGFFVGIVPGSLAKVFRKIFPESYSLPIWCGAGWGGFLGTLSYPILVGWGGEPVSLRGEFFQHLAIILSVAVFAMVWGLVALGGKVLLEKIR